MGWQWHGLRLSQLGRQPQDLLLLLLPYPKQLLSLLLHLAKGLSQHLRLPCLAVCDGLGHLLLGLLFCLVVLLLQGVLLLLLLLQKHLLQLLQPLKLSL